MTKTRLIIAFSILVVTSACSLFSTNDGEDVIYAKTEVGTPVGDKVTKDIGPAGGTLSSPDGRLTLTVPQNALAETTAFTIQPITNNVPTGIGAAYRLGPDGKTFTTPIQISVHYDEEEVAGTVPEALSIAYQDSKGAWHAPKAAKLDDKAKTLTITTVHFTDFSLLTRLRIVPPETKVYVGGSTQITLMACEGDTVYCKELTPQKTKWNVRGEGTIKESAKTEYVTYTAPGKKPSPNIAWVTVDIEFDVWDSKTGELTRSIKTFAAKITIVDRGYRVSGEGGGLTYSGVICSLDRPFTVYGSAYNYNFKFTPSSESNGTWAVDTSIGVGKLKGGGAYTIENLYSDKPRIKVMGNVDVTVPYAQRTGGGTHYFDLTPLDTDECIGK